MIRLVSNTKIQVFIITVLVVLAYSNSLFNGFAIDDHLFIVDWQVTKDLKNIPQMFTKDFAPGMGEHSGIYRPLRAVFYAISYKLWGTNPFSYHLQAILVHVGVTVLVFYTVRLILQGLSFAKERPFTAFAASLLFGLHPIHTEAVDYLTANFDAISYIFFFGSFYLYLRSRIGKLGYLVYLSYLAAALAFFTLEMTLVLPLLLVLYDSCFRFKSLKFLKSLRLLKGSLPYFFLAGFYLLIRVFLLHITARGEYLGGSIYITVLTMIKVWGKYVWLLIFPVNLSVNPTITEGINSWVGPASLTNKLLSQSLFDKETILGILGVLGILGLAIKLRKKFPLITFGIGWFFISLLPVSYIIPQGPIMQERYVYLASFGFAVVAGWLLGKLGRLGRLGRLGVLGGLVFLALFYGIVTFQRNKDWKSGESIWFSLIKQIPNDPYTNLVIGTYYEQKQKYQLALNYYQNALKNKPDYYEAYLKMAQVTIKFGKWNKYQDSNLIFFYPKNWKLSTKDAAIKIYDPKQLITISLYLSNQITQSETKYLRETLNYGDLINEGRAKLPNFEKAYVKVFNDQGVRKLEFFMFKNKKVFKVLVYPGDSVLMKDFDIIVSSLKIL